MTDLAIKVENVKKQYRLGAIGGGTLSADLESWWARKRGKEDPNTLIGTDQTRIGERFNALDGVSFEVKKGEAVGIIGTNGAGKSTLLKLLSRVTAPTEGNIYLNGRITSMLEVGTGFHPELTGRENIYMNGAILGMTKNEIDEKIEEIIDFSECRQFIDTPVKRYSSGMYVKLGFAVAAHLDSEIMIMDEVLAVGDVKFQKKCLGSMSDAANHAGKTILYVSHNMNTIRQLCTRCIVLNHGRIIYDGEVEKAIEIYAGDSAVDRKVFFNLDEASRPSMDHGNIVRLTEFEFVDKQIPVFSNKEKIRMRLKWISNMDIKDLRFRIRLNNADTSPVGLAESDIIGEAVANQERECIIEWDISNIVEGTYYCVIDLYVTNEYGTRSSYDHPITKIGIQIEDHIGGSEKNTMWDRKSWNSVRLNTIHTMTRID